MCVVCVGGGVMTRSHDVFVAVWIIVQMALPLHYYAVRQFTDPLNEWFAWRMFSDTHHGGGFVDWYMFVGESDAGLEIKGNDLVVEVGWSPTVAKFLTGGVRGARKAPPVWAMKRAADFLCEVYRPANVTAIGARRTIVPWKADAEIVEQEFAWPCGEE